MRRVPGTVRGWGILLLPLVFGAGALGVASAGEQFALASPLLIAHLVVGGAAVASGAAAYLATRRVASRRARGATGLTMAALWATAVTGGAFLLTRSASGGVVDQGLALASLIGTLLMIAMGAPIDERT